MRKPPAFRRSVTALCCLLLALVLFPTFTGYAAEADRPRSIPKTGGGYAATNQVEGVGYAAKLYNADNGLPTSDANCILADSRGYIWIGGYSGVIRYDGTAFERLPSSTGLTNAKALYEDAKGRLWIGTNDNGVVIMDDRDLTHFTYKDGLASSSIRGFAEAPDGTVYIGTTNGLAYVDNELVLHSLDDPRLTGEYIIQMAVDPNGVIYANTRDSDILTIKDRKVTAFYRGDDLNMGNITAIHADRSHPGCMYFGTNSDKIYYGSFANGLKDLRAIDVSPAAKINSIYYAAGRLFILSGSAIGYLDPHESYHALDHIPIDSAIETMDEDYQGNLWVTSSRQGVMKIVTNNFKDLTSMAGVDGDVVNSTCLHDGMLFAGTDKGLQILTRSNTSVNNDLTKYLENTRIRCISEGKDYDLWISTYTNNLGLVHYTADGEITSYNEENGFINNETRSTVIASDGSVLSCTNGGLAVIKDGKVVRTVDSESGIANTVFLTVAEGDHGEYYVGTDGDGIYIIDGNKIVKKGRDAGLTSDVILRIKKDPYRNVIWIITSNSVEFLKDGEITQVEGFPYSNNYDVYFDENGGLWFLASNGIFRAKAEDLLANGNVEYEFYDTANGLPSVPTGNSFSSMDQDGNLYIAGRNGVSKVNINNYFDQSTEVKTEIRYITCNDELIYPDETGRYTIPPVEGRIQIKASILDYTLSNPMVHIFLEGAQDPGITATQRNLTALEYTGLRYGDYTLHIQLLDPAKGTVFQDSAYPITKRPRFFENLAVQMIMVLMGTLFVIFVVYRIMTGTIIRRQYEQIRIAKDEAERANSAKSRFLANMSHEIRTPINTIMGMDEMILRENPDKVPEHYFIHVTSYAKDIMSASESLLTLVNDVLDLSKIESGKMNLVEQEYDIENLLRSIITMIRVRCRQKDLTFSTKIDPTLPRKLYGDMGKIKQIVLNLLTNAVKYTEHGGLTLTVSVTEKEEDQCGIRYSVKDTGIGIRPEDMDKLFSAFQRLEEERNSGIQGTGLGLDISRQFASLMGGELTCDSVYGEGSDFVLSVRQKILDPEEIGVFDEKGGDQASDGPYVPLFCASEARILVVDDNPMNLTVIKGLLSATKVNVITAESGEECLKKLKNESFHVVLLDHMMPGMDGIETLSHIREMGLTLPVFALTANIAAGGEEFYRERGFDGYLTKPVNSRLLERTLKENLPAELLEEAEAASEAGDRELPEEMKWLYDVDGIDVEKGIKSCGAVDPFLYSVNLFYNTITGNSEVLENALKDGDIRLFTVKVHALKSSARIVGAKELEELAKKLEDAGNSDDRAFIDENTPRLFTLYRSYREKLSKLESCEAGGEEDNRALMSPEEYEEALEALRELVGQMDYDGVENVLSQVREYRLSPEAEEHFAAVEAAVKTFNWDKMEEVVGR